MLGFLRITSLTTILLVAALAIFLGSVPQRDLDWNVILKLAQNYADVDDSVNAPLEGKLAVITGCTNGIGLSLTRALSKLGATVVGVGRSEQRLAKLKLELPTVVTIRADLNDLESVSQGANEILQQFDRIDMIINNAGMHDSFNNLWGNAVSPQNFDRVFAVNYLSHFLLTEKLVAPLSKSDKPTILQITSMTHWSVDGTDLSTSRLVSPESMPTAARPGGSTGFILFRSWRSYATSKLAQIYHARAWTKKNQNSATLSKIRFVTACPGWVGTSIGGDPGGFFHTMMQGGFPVDGWGIASPLVALFNNSNSSVDYYINSGFYEFFNLMFGDKPLPGWFYKSALRDTISFVSGMVAIPLQRLKVEVLPGISSPESYNITIAEELLEWSYKAVNQYL